MPDIDGHYPNQVYSNLSPHRVLTESSQDHNLYFITFSHLFLPKQVINYIFDILADGIVRTVRTVRTKVKKDEWPFLFLSLEVD